MQTLTPPASKVIFGRLMRLVYPAGYKAEMAYLSKGKMRFQSCFMLITIQPLRFA